MKEFPQKRLDPVLHGFKLDNRTYIPELKTKILRIFGYCSVKEA